MAYVYDIGLQIYCTLLYSNNRIWRAPLIDLRKLFFSALVCILCLSAFPALSFAQNDSRLSMEEASSEQVGTEDSRNILAGEDMAEVQPPAVESDIPDISPPEDSEERKEQKIRTPSSAETFFSTTEFTEDAARDPERLKAAAVDLDIVQFGYDFFSNAGAFEPDPLSLVGPDYVIGPGDTMKVDVWGNIEGTYEAPVDRNGDITLPKVGVIHLWGQTFSQATETIRKQIAKYFTDFEFNVTMGSLRSIQVYIVGEVSSPGTYQVSSLSTVLTALSEAGGPTKGGTLRNIQLKRSGKLVVTIDLYDFFLNGDRSSDVRLQSGDTLFVPVVGPLVGIAGGVRRPAIYELKGDQTLEQALELAGGVLPTAYLQKVQLDRVEAHQTKTVIDISVGESSAQENHILLKDLDRIQVSPIAMDSDYVLLEGYVVRPGRYQLTRGMRISDLILPYENLLPEYYPETALVIRMDPPEYTQKLITVNLQKVLDNDPTHNLLLQEYDTVKLFSRSEMEELPEVVVNGSVLAPGTYRLYDNMTVQDLVTVAGNLKRSAYTGEAEITRYISSSGLETHTERILIDLEKALQGDPENNISLKTDDHLFIRSIPDFEDKETVQILGEVMFPGTYSIEKGEKLSSLIERAGGYKEDAYLRGAFFTRESLKETQRLQTNNLISEQENEILRISSEISAGALNEEDIDAAQAILESRTQLLEKLKQTPITGRMIVNLERIDKSSDSDDNIELMSGDILTVPVNPKTVTVLGQVYTPTSMASSQGKTVDYYLNLVGGPKENAETSEMYIVRANGSVVSKQQSSHSISWSRDHNRWLSGGFNNEILYPGDVLLVPEKVKTSDWMKDTKDITTILYQISIGAAVVLAL